ncbi:hypothetical protein BMH32_03720 [Leucobacter sp. OLJS4]|uniref:hypothetical protein n=1 Tax=unclassified Leucobacter TaxID=2621730 RepID=UPI000C192924|nr:MULTISPECIES: hypothetical protein [unclassified Leucobacter]PIJ47787.1 hypothetical protein BMH30_06715 [Leucobacter sp. OLES1]PII82804.1 hypothetical protein BMH25_08645 [Leucobacter sp. OLCALW19]PII88089.1 hypothetical protein BMH26_07455 [Leucobacter sp. OLTLW20]PII91947.1 hypothetical protein BMH27_07540 [Leucobacter sp. OLAS13]PII99002.1 hypothetical protein BMH28_11645 [Leucobacter sp. OLCS4]
MRRIFGKPVVWAALLIAAASVLFATGSFGLSDDWIVPFLLTLLGGWFAGNAILDGLNRVEPFRIRIMLHVGATAAIALTIWAMFLWTKPLAQTGILPDSGWGVFFALQMAGLVTVAWLALALLHTVTALVKVGSKPVERRLPEWEAAESDGAIVRFSAAPMRFGALTGVIVGTVIVASLLGAGLMLAFPAVMNVGPMVVIIAFALVIGLPLYAIISAMFRARSRRCSILFGDRRLRLEVGDDVFECGYAQLDELLWRRGSEYARIELSARGEQRSLIVGVAKQPPEVAPNLPELPRRTKRLLEAAGLEDVSSAREVRSGLTRYRRQAVPASATG